MFRNILRAFKREMKNLDWMDSRTKRKALEKANRVEGFIGYPSWLKDPSSVDEYYAGLHFNNNSFFKNILIMMKWISEKAIREYPGPVDKRWTSDSPAEADAFYDDERNAISMKT
jgi:predicted metalloendopeptidase